MNDLGQTLKDVTEKVGETINRKIFVYMPDKHGNLTRQVGDAADKSVNDRERLIAEWAYQHQMPAGKGTNMLSEVPCIFRPLVTEKRPYGVLVIHTDQQLATREQRRLVDAACNLSALAIVRAKMSEDIAIAKVAVESERLHVILLDSISHELRTPLTAMIGSATVLIENDNLFSRKDRQELLENIQKGAMRMNHIVANLLGMVQLESGMLHLNRTWCDLEDIIGVVLHQLDDKLSADRLKLIISEDFPPVYIDEVLFEQALVNIFGNALKYSPEGSLITLEASMQRDKAHIAVSDCGSGVPEEQLKPIFDKFYRLKTPSSVPGTGLGLAIVKGIVEAHGGQVSAYNHHPHGLTLLIVLGSEATTSKNKWT